MSRVTRALATVRTLTAQGVTMVCFFVVFRWSPKLLKMRRGPPMVANMTVQGMAGTRDATTTMKIVKL